MNTRRKARPCPPGRGGADQFASELGGTEWIDQGMLSRLNDTYVLRATPAACAKGPHRFSSGRVHRWRMEKSADVAFLRCVDACLPIPEDGR